MKTKNKCIECKKPADSKIKSKKFDMEVSVCDEYYCHREWDIKGGLT